MLEPISATTNMGNFNVTYLPTYAIDQSGLAAPYISGVTAFTPYVSTTGTVSGGGSLNTWYSSANTTTGNFDFYLGVSHTIDAFVYWADPQGVGQSVNSFQLLADNNAAFSTATVLGTYTAQDGTGNANNSTNFGQVFQFAPVSATYVRMQILSNHGSTLTTAIVEGAFDAVPEPASLGILGGVMLIGLRRGSRKQR